MSFESSLADPTPTPTPTATPTPTPTPTPSATPTPTPSATPTPAPASDPAPADSAFDIEVDPAAPPAVDPNAAPAADPDPADPPADPADAVPDVYADFDAPEGVALDPALVDDLKAVAKELKLPQAAAQKLADLGVKQAQAFAEAGAKVVETEQASWLTASRADPEIGGEKLKAVLAEAKTGLAAFGSPAMGEFLRDTKLNTHPEFIRLFAKLGKLASEDGFVPSTATTNGADKTIADRLYPTKKGK